MLQPAQSADNSPPLAVRLRSTRQIGRFGVNRVKDGHTIGTLRATGGPPGSAGLLSSGRLSNGIGSLTDSTNQDRGHRSTSLFDLPHRGSGVLSKLQGQVKSSNPLLSGLSGDSPTPGTRQALFTGGTTGASHSLSVARSRVANLRRQSTSIDGRSRFVQAQTSLLRSTGGFGTTLSSGFNFFA
jgi:hypothetical protein